MVKKALLGQLSDTDIRLLRVFRAVVECGGFSAAELELNINRSTISRHIKDFEIRLGVNLCQRGRGGFSLTAEGSQIYDAGLRLLASIDEFRAEVDDVHLRLTGTLNIAIIDKTVTNPQAAVAKSLQLFDDMAPDADIRVSIEPINEIESAVIDGRFQLGIVPGHRTSSSLNYVHLYDEQMYLYCGSEHELFSAKDSTITKQKILDCKYAGLGYHSPNMDISKQQDMRRRATSCDQEAIALLILSGRYLGYLPDHFAKSFVEQKVMRPIGQKTFQYLCQLSAITRRSPQPSRLTQTFLNALIRAHGN